MRNEKVNSRATIAELLNEHGMSVQQIIQASGHWPRVA